MPPGIMLSPVTPLSFAPITSLPRPASAVPYERLVLLSSRVHMPQKVAEAVLPNVAVVVYDWKNFTMQEMVMHIKKVLGQNKVVSIAVIAPGNKPGCVGLLDGATTTPETLRENKELAQFWRVLAGCVAANGVNDGRRIDLLGCRVVESPREGAALLKELWRLTSVPFAAADDALGGYMLATFLEEPNSGQLSLISSTIKGVDLYFNRYTLLGIPPPMPGEVPEADQQPRAATPLPLPTPPAQTPGHMTPPTTQPAPPQPAPVPVPVPVPTLPAQQPAAQHGDIFNRFAAEVAKSGLTLDQVFKQYDKDGNGTLDKEEVVNMVRNFVKDAKMLDIEHFRAIMDLDGNNKIDMSEFVSAIQKNAEIELKVKSGKDNDQLMETLHTYLTDERAIIESVFQDADANHSGTLDHREVAELVSSIRGLTQDEQNYIITYIYYSDKNGDGQISFEELLNCVASFGKPAPVTYAKAVKK